MDRFPHDAPVERIRLPDAADGRLVFAQVREDPVLEIEALRAGPADRVVAVSSGGCTALSLLAAGAGHVTAVDVNATQNHLVDLKRAAVARLGAGEAVTFLGGAPASHTTRLAQYPLVREALTTPSRAWWDGRPALVGGGALHAGLSERFLAAVAAVIRGAVHPRARVGRLLASPDLAEQRRRYEREWDTWRWRALFTLLCNRGVLRRAYDPSFFAHVESPSFARHFRQVAAHTLAEIPVASNYFVHHLLTGRYPAHVAGGLPPYLAGDAWAPEARLRLVDGSVTSWLRRLPAGSVDAFALSNILEWLDPSGVDALFAEVARTARPGARLVFRNFVGWSEVPPRWTATVREDRAAGEALIGRDRSGVQRRIAVCRIAGHIAGGRTDHITGHREATP